MRKPARSSDTDQGRVILFNKPFGVLTRFTDDQGRSNLSDFIEVPGVYPVGRLDADSEGLLVLTDRATLVEPLLRPGEKEKSYLVCVEHEIAEPALKRLREGVQLKEGQTLPARAKGVEEPTWLWSREPPIRVRRSIPTSWLELTLREGKNRQVRRMTAAVGHPTLRLLRLSMGPLLLSGLKPGEWRDVTEREWAALLALEAGHPRRPSRRRGHTGGKPRGGTRS